MYCGPGPETAIDLPFSVRLALGLLIALGGAAFDLAGLLAFRRARTTYNPLRPERAKRIVSDGVYRHTRNPMYVGMALLLLGWAVGLGNAMALLGPVVFVAYITCFQILPEERALLAKFGADYADYLVQVRRWL